MTKTLGLVSLPCDFSWLDRESAEYQALRREYLGLYAQAKANIVWANVDESALGSTDNVYRLNAALLSFMGILAKEGHEISYFSNPATIEREVEEFVKAEHPDIIFFSCSHSTSLPMLERLSARVKELSPRTLTAVGGQYVSGAEFVPDGIDVLVKGDGFVPAYYLADAPAEKWLGTHSIMHSFDVPEKARADFASKHEAFPYMDLSGVDFELPLSRLYFQMGCLPPDGRYQACKYCGSRTNKKHSLACSVRRVISTMGEMVSRLGTQHIFIGDEDFLGVREAAEKIIAALEEWRAQNPLANLTLSMQCRAESVRENLDLLPSLAALGVTEIHLGIETTSQEIVDNFGGKNVVENIEGTLRAIREAGIFVLAHFLFGLPGETKGTLRTTIEQISQWMELGLVSFPEIRYPVFFPGTPYGDRPEEAGIKMTERRPEQLIPEKEFPTFRYEGFSDREMAEKLRLAYRVINANFRRQIAANPQLRQKTARLKATPL